MSTTEWLAGGTDLMERRRSGVSHAAIQMLSSSTVGSVIAAEAGGGLRIGAGVTIAALAANEAVRAGYPGLAAAAGGLATPQIRNTATVGGNLTQRTRCWYFRNPQVACLKKGGTDCPARRGNHLYGVVFDLGPCVAPHPSTLAAAFMAYDARVTTSARSGLSVSDVLGDGRDGARDHQLAADELLTAIYLPPSLAGERAVYKRAVSRTHAEWPLVEIVVRVVLAAGRVTTAGIALGGIAAVPLRLAAVEARLVGAALDDPTIAEASRLAVHGAKPLPQTGYKVALMEGLVRDALEVLAKPA
jgi:xanthine dehydrogenase YagS FAD-binding subunit